MYLASLPYLILVPGMACAFSGGLFPAVHKSALHKRSQTQIGGFLGNPRRARSIDDAGTSNPRRAAPRKLQAFPNEYEAFFNKASKSGADAITTLTPEERAQRAMEVGKWLAKLLYTRVIRDNLHNVPCQCTNMCVAALRLVCTAGDALHMLREVSTHRIAACRSSPCKLNMYKKKNRQQCSAVLCLAFLAAALAS